MPRQYLPQPNDRVRHERLGEESRLGIPIPYRICGNQSGGDRQSCLSSRTAEAGGAWISCEGHAARQLTKQDYEDYDLLIGMDQANLRNMYRICGGDLANKISLLMDHTDHPGDVADPWYTGDFEATWQDVLTGCRGLLKGLTKECI